MQNKSYIYNTQHYRFEATLKSNIKVKIYNYGEDQLLLYVGQFGLYELPSSLRSSQSISQFFQLFGDEDNLQVFAKAGKFVLKVIEASTRKESKYMFGLEKVQPLYARANCKLIQEKQILYRETEKLQNQFLMLQERNKHYQTLLREKEKILTWTVPSTSSSITQLTSPFSHDFEINQSTTTYTGQDYEWNQILMKREINPHNVDRFSCKILKTRGRRLFIGIADYQTQKNKKYSHHSGNAVSYWGYNGRVWYGSVSAGKYKDEGIGFDEGQKVTVEINLKNRVIRWIVKGQSRAMVESELLGEQNRKFVPFVDFYNTGDSIEWSQ